jgi:hypothetical protein
MYFEKEEKEYYNIQMKIEKLEKLGLDLLHIPYLQSGGLITNYYCSSQCRHCLYASSPRRNKKYIDGATAAALFRKIKSMGCYSLHIGGGEPFLNINGLKIVLKAAQMEDIVIEYVETNSSWYKDHTTACRILEELQKFSMSRVLVSISPFHNEYIPFYKVKGVIAACQDVGISIFPWIYDFFDEINSFPDDRPHNFSQFEQAFGRHYLRHVFQKYWIQPGGRVFTACQQLFGKKNTQALVNVNTPCIELANTSHFHFDLYGNYIPGLCSGIQIHYQDLDKRKPICKVQYPYLHVLYTQGINGLYRIAADEYDFSPQGNYSSKCHLCLEIRRFLIIEIGLEIHEFGPKGFYEEISL